MPALGDERESLGHDAMARHPDQIMTTHLCASWSNRQGGGQSRPQGRLSTPVPPPPQSHLHVVQDRSLPVAPAQIMNIKHQALPSALSPRYAAAKPASTRIS